ncbi:MAG: FAD binding domain-containing protein [Rhodothalassiaceae bacterium]
MYPFVYHRAESLADAAGKLAEADDGVLLAGGMTLLPTLKQRLARPSHVIDLGGLSSLGEIVAGDKRISLGAMVTHRAIEHHSGLAAKLPALPELAAVLGDRAVRARGTIGGSLANADPAADYPAAILALDSCVVTQKRQIDGTAFFRDLFETALEPDEIITRIDCAIPQAAAYEKFRHPLSRYAMVGVFVARYPDRVRVGITGAAAFAFRWHAAEEALHETFHEDALSELKIDSSDFLSDLHGPADYRGHLVGVMTRRAVARARHR